MPPNTETGEIENTVLDTAAPPAADNTQDTKDASVATGENTAQQPSSGQDETDKAEGPKSMAEAITAVLEGAKKPDEADDEKEPDGEPAKAADPAAAPADDKGTKPEESKQPAGDGEAADDDPTDAELKDFGPKAQKRIKKLLSQRNEARRNSEALTEDATHYRNIRQFMSEAKLDDKEVSELFEVGRLLKGTDVAGYEKALNIVLPKVQQLLELTGRSLPKELQTEVENGALTEEHARELARNRARATVAETAARLAREDAERNQQQQAQSAQQGAVQRAVADWEKRVSQSDPDFGLKAAALRDAALALVAERGQPKSPEEAVQFAQATYDRVNQWFSAARPKPQPSRPAPSGGNGNRQGLAPEPKSLRDAVLGALNATAP